MFVENVRFDISVGIVFPIFFCKLRWHGELVYSVGFQNDTSLSGNEAGDNRRFGSPPYFATDTFLGIAATVQLKGMASEFVNIYQRHCHAMRTVVEWYTVACYSNT